MNTHRDVEIIAALAFMPGTSRREWKTHLTRLRQQGVSLRDLVTMDSEHAQRWFDWNPPLYRQWLTLRERVSVHASRLRHSDVRVLCQLNTDLPGWFENLSAVPWIFYVGELDLLQRQTLGFSGQREASPEALRITSALATAAVGRDMTVISGGARGIDMQAHSMALEAGGTTVFVLPQGVDTWIPPQGVRSDDFAGRVLAISEDVPWEVWNTESAMRRNRLIVELSHVFTVPQSGTSGGSHSTGVYGLKQGRVVYVPDLGLGYPGNAELLQRGARLLPEPFDLDLMIQQSRIPEKPSQLSLL